MVSTESIVYSSLQVRLAGMRSGEAGIPVPVVKGYSSIPGLRRQVNQKRCQEPFPVDKSRKTAYTRRMGRPRRAAEGGLIYHVLNRANARMTIFEKAQDFEAFEWVLEQAVERFRMRLLAYCVMPNHWHMVVWPEERRSTLAFRRLVDVDAHPTLACASTQHGFRPSLPRPLQIVSRSRRRALPHGLPLRPNETRRERISSNPPKIGNGPVCTAGHTVRRKRNRC